MDFVRLAGGGMYMKGGRVTVYMHMLFDASMFGPTKAEDAPPDCRSEMSQTVMVSKIASDPTRGNMAER